jgi:signal transduction histidine kinase
LDANLITITPSKVELLSLIKDAIKMFRPECAKEDIKLQYYEDPSLAKEGASWVMLDQSRALQVLINGMTNAVKFTRDQPVRSISVHFGATKKKPSEMHNWDGIVFDHATATPSTRDQLKRKRSTFLDGDDDNGSGANIFIWIKVKDTGFVHRFLYYLMFSHFHSSWPCRRFKNLIH